MATSKSNRTRVFVYGTLKEGFGNHAYYLAGNPEVVKLGRCYIEGDFKMYTNGAFPVVVKDKSDEPRKIVGEVYEVDEETLLSLDSLEGHPDWYQREKVETPWKKAWVYLMPPSEYAPGEPVPTGCFEMTTEEEAWLRGTESAA